jgi:hypothetical protein
VAAPRRQPAAIGLRAGRRAEDGDFGEWRRQAALATLRRAGASLEFTPGGGAPAISYVPGERATIGGAPMLSGASGGEPPLAAPFLSSPERGTWELSFGGVRRRFAPLP